MTGYRQGGSPLWLEHLQILSLLFFFFFSLLSFLLIHPMFRICLYIRGRYVFFISYLSSSASKFFPFLHSIQFFFLLFSFLFSVLCLVAPHLTLTPPPFRSPFSSGVSRIPIPYPSVCQCLNHSSLSSLSLSLFFLVVHCLFFALAFTSPLTSSSSFCLVISIPTPVLSHLLPLLLFLVLILALFPPSLLSLTNQLFFMNSFLIIPSTFLLSLRPG